MILGALPHGPKGILDLQDLPLGGPWEDTRERVSQGDMNSECFDVPQVSCEP